MKIPVKTAAFIESSVAADRCFCLLHAHCSYSAHFDSIHSTPNRMSELYFCLLNGIDKRSCAHVSIQKSKEKCIQMNFVSYFMRCESRISRIVVDGARLVRF